MVNIVVFVTFRIFVKKMNFFTFGCHGDVILSGFGVLEVSFSRFFRL
jgi:hypothetical protein